MAEMLVDSTKLNACLGAEADAIRAKTGGSADIPFDYANGKGFADAIAAISSKETLSWHQCPEAVRDYLANVTYDPSDYTASLIATYAPAAAAAANTKPVGVTSGGVTYCNAVPNKQTPFANTQTAGTLEPLDRLRWINSPTATNVRDLGGWACDGGTVRYGLLFRGGEPTAQDIPVLVDECGVKFELNLRGRSEANREYSILGNIGYAVFDTCAWYSIADTTLWKKMLRAVFDAINYSIPVYFHCAAGLDRTGTMACILEALLGMSQSDCDKEYELSCFSTGTDTDQHARRRDEADWRGLISAINAKNGSTFRDKVVSFVLSLGFSIDTINAFRVAMIDGDPEILVSTNYTVTNTLTNVSNSNADTTAEEHQPYTATLKPSPEYLIDSVSVTMGGVDITSQVFSGTEAQPVATKYSVVNNLTNCDTSNSATQVTEGTAYTATLSPHSGYAVNAVTITMGGVDVSQYYSNGAINIPSVTGNIVITATAAKVGPPNMISSAINSDGTPYNNGQGYKSGYRLNSRGLETAQSNAFVTGFMPVAKNDVIHFVDTFIRSVAGHPDTSLSYVALYDSSFNSMVSMQGVSMVNDSSHWTFTVDSTNNTLETFTIVYNGSSYNFDNVAYMRISSANLSADSYIYKES